MTKAAHATTPLYSAGDIAKTIASSTPVEPSVPTDIVLDGVAILLTRAAKAISPNTKSAEKVLTSIAKIETLAGIPGEIQTPWLALRALGLPSGAQIGITARGLDNPVVAALIAAAGLIPTTDMDDTVRGVVGSLGGRDLDTLTATSRIVKMTDTIVSVSNHSGTIFNFDASQTDAALQAIASKCPNRTAGAKAKIGAMPYNTVDAAQLSEFAAAVFSPYRVRRLEIPNAKTHPTDLVESAALSSVLPPVPGYAPHFHPEIVDKGILSDVQLEAVVYAGEAHSKFLPENPDDDAKTPPRQGFLVGHGTGVGKGRIGAGIIADNWAQNRRRHIWFSESARLIEDARRDWIALGGKADDVIDIRELNSEAPIPPFSGIIFATYASLRTVTENSTRLRQLTDWFGQGEDGVVLFDEAQNLRNAKTPKESYGHAEISLQGQAALDLQESLPNARVTYISATSASDIVSLGFAIRLGLWGKSTAFPTAKAFFKAMDEGGTNALEMVARDLKAMGLYLAANLSFDGVKYERLARKLTVQERDAQDRLADLWLRVNDGLRRASVSTGVSRLPVTTRGRGHRLGDIHFAMARARFFQSLLASLNTPQMIDSIRTDIANGHSAIIQMTNTFAANADRAIDDAEENGTDINAVEASAKDILLGYLRSQFPTIKYHAVRRGKKVFSEPVLDANGDPVICQQAVKVRDDLIADVMAVPVPEGPLEQLMKAFGTDMVAEITGRSRRLVPGRMNGQVVEDRCPEDVANDLKAFVNDAKQILVFSQAGGTGATYSAQRTFRNQRLRRHYVLQAGWRADLALQGMGRSHRSDQAQPPEYILLSTDLWANQRMVSAVAKGMRDLGALTRGLRQAASQDFFTADDNLEDEFGQTAWINFVGRMARGNISGLSIGQFEREACIKLRDHNGALNKHLPPVKRFLNAMSAMSCDNQALFGQHYRAELQELKLQAVEDGSFDRGIETITPDSLIKLEDQVIYRDPRTGGETRMLKMLRVDELKPVDYDEARRKAMARGNTRVVKSLMTGRIAILSFPRIRHGSVPSPDDKVEVIMPTGSRIRSREEVVQERWVQVEATMAQHLWDAELKERGDEEEREFWVVSGAMLPIWDKLPGSRSTVFRMETDEGEQVIGRVMTEDFVSSLLKRVDALTGGGLAQPEVDEILMKGGICTLANGWVLGGRVHTYTGKLTLTLSMPLSDETAYASLIRTAQLKRTIGAMTNQAYFKIPVADADRAKSLAHMLAHAPAVGGAAF
jgi:hypothetical protein